jgi:hemerythrin-like domain-containing protein
VTTRNQAIANQLLTAHAGLRDELNRVRAEIGNAIAGRPPKPVDRSLLAHCLTFCDNLHTHHTKEDDAFTMLDAEFPELVPAFARFRAEHRVVATTLTELRALLDRDNLDRDSVVELRGELEQLATRLEDHFAHEEEKLIPALSG